VRRIAALIALGGGLAAIAATSPAASAASRSSGAVRAERAARSVRVTFVNATNRTLRRTDNQTYRGRWTIDPAGSNSAFGGSNVFRTESNGFLPGTEAAVVYTTSNCAKPGRTVRFHWNNPYFGRNTYDWNQTDPTFSKFYSGGSGDNASVVATVREL
jgi:hypothetical protein